VDFTYIVALLFSLVVGFVGSVLFVLARGKYYWRFLVIAPTLTVIADFALMEDWSRASEFTAKFLLTDAALFALYAIVGCAVGALPVLGVHWFIRAVKRNNRRLEEEG
jgi:hypothetical protein